MGQVTAEVDARSGTIAPSDTSPERWHQSAAMTIQQTKFRECGNNVPTLALSSQVWELTPIFGRKSERSIGPLPTGATSGANPFVVRSADRPTFAELANSAIRGHLSSSSALPCGSALREVQ
jgi:hypothetical protein